MVIVDIETTGLDPAKHSILSIGAVDFLDPTNRFYGECRMADGSECTSEALAINGFSLEQITDSKKQSVAQLVTNFFTWLDPIKNKTFAGQNVWFDRDFIAAACRQHNLPHKIDKRLVDLHAVCYAKFVETGQAIPLREGYSGLTTDTILSFVGLDKRPGTHNALDDALLEAESFSRLIRGKALLSQYHSFPLVRRDP